ncbi:hypothetical protein AKJ64_02490 [candidate division MSBL1 archaeon SCGC-AAA259E17]|uniref:Response regulatory domain-containing protein n=1 Tax=candidate division MSBL1 archaeon SCGC-AAA259E17 TaxID=1698263 RepID=A0A133UEM2_9EURY|nr:hypothetical protein AKJ64_02490 [candidate division MSBL1 archaeon SCGC-AAA259E17]
MEAVNLRVLLVDDEPDLLKQGKIFLKMENEELEVETTTFGEEAYQMVKNEDFDAIISDYILPDMDGIEILEKLREEGDDVTFIIFTGRDSEEMEKKSLESGADKFLKKGRSPKTLYKKIAEEITASTE